MTRTSFSWLLVFVGLSVGGVVGSSCTVDYPTVAFRCDPRQSDNCPETHFCCSDDPAAEGGMLPAYEGKNIDGGVPYFSGINNALSTEGMCVRREDIPAGAGLTAGTGAGCPIPCNPTWSEADIGVVCGAGRQCCQTQPLEPADCVFVDGQWRPVTGHDIGVEDENGNPITMWRYGEHATNQDPLGEGCRTIAGGDTDSDVYRDCVRQLTVADQRGFCLALDPGQVCPAMQPGFTNACDQLGAATPAG